MKNWLKVIAASLILAMPISFAMSDYTVTQGSGTTVFSFVCFVSKVCPGSVPITSAGVEISPATAANQATEIASLATIASNTGAAVPTQAPTVSIGGVGIIDSAGTNVATVKAASTLPVATDKTLVVGLNPGTATAGSPTGAIVTVQGVSGGTPQPVTPSLATSGGMTPFFLQPTASDNHTVVKAGAGQVYGVFVFNNSATVNYLRFYNATTGFNGCNSATNHVTQIQIPASTSVGGVSIPLPFPIPFATGISICVTSGYALTDTTNATASAMSLTIGYN